jgi:hypothetical protein
LFLAVSDLVQKKPGRLILKSHDPEIYYSLSKACEVLMATKICNYGDLLMEYCLAS